MTGPQTLPLHTLPTGDDQMRTGHVGEENYVVPVMTSVAVCTRYYILAAMELNPVVIGSCSVDECAKC